MAKLLEEKKLYVESPKKIVLNNISVGGKKIYKDIIINKSPEKKLGKNATVLFDSTEFIINKALLNLVDANEDPTLDCYNVFEQSYGTTKALKRVMVEGLILNAKSTNNIVSMYTFADNAEITFRNCEFVLCDGSNALRVDNRFDCHNVVITFDNCKWSFQSTAKYGKNWDALMIFQDSVHLDTPHFADWKLVVKNCKFGEEAINPESFAEYADFVITNEESKNGKALLYMYTARTGEEVWWKPAENPELFPVVKIVAGNAAKEFKAE